MNEYDKLVALNSHTMDCPHCKRNIVFLDRLGHIFVLQEMLQQRLKTTYNQEFINNMTLALHAEAVELLDSTPWKPWKKVQVYDEKNYIYELADIIHFTVNLALAKDFSAGDLYEEYVKKNRENHKRQDDGY